MAELIDETGNRYGRLLVLERFEDSKCKRRVEWVCQCDCGEFTTVTGNHLRTGNTKSCGCLRKENLGEFNKLRTLPRGVAAFNAMIGRMKLAAEKRDHKWQLTNEQVRHLTKQRCYYCGVKPLQTSHAEAYNGDYVHNGIDRVDNERGYTIDNVVSCCGKCNLMKRAMSLQEFRSQIITIYNHFASAKAFATRK